MAICKIRDRTVDQESRKEITCLKALKSRLENIKNVIIINLMTIFIDLARLVDKTIDLC